MTPLSSVRFTPYIILPVLLWLCLLPCAALGSSSIHKAVDNGDDTLKFVWVILAEGYTQAAEDKFADDAAVLIDAFLTTSPFKEYQSAINIYTLFTASDESGADHPSDGMYVDTAFDATYDSYGMARLLTVSSAKAFNAALQVPHFDVIFVLVNDDQYGGSGGSVIAVSTHGSSQEIALHEAGHVVGKLADEYETPYPDYPKGDGEPNVTFQTDPSKIPWKDWIESDTQIPTPDHSKETIGLFEGARYLGSGIYRSTFTSKMRSLNQPFHEVNTEALVVRIYDYVSPITNFGPRESEVFLSPGRTATLWFEPLKQDSTDVIWEIDNEILENESLPRLALPSSALKQGKHTVSLWVSDVTDMVQSDPRGVLTARQSWTVQKNFCSGKLSGRIIDGTSNLGVAGAVVQVDPSDKTVVTDEEGVYAFEDMACDTYLVEVQAEGLNPVTKEMTVLDGQTAALDLQLEPGAGSYYIRGSITGDLPEGVKVTLSGSGSASVETDATGTFTLGPLKDGTYSIEPHADGYRFSPRSHKVTIDHKSIYNLTFNAGKAGFFHFIAGRIQGDITEGVVVALSGEKTDSVISDAQGNFMLENLPPGQYVIKPRLVGAVFEPAQVEVELSDADPTDIQFQMRESACAASQFFSRESRQLQQLRQLRENVLNKNQTGRRYVRLYYQASPEVSRLLRQNPDLKTEASTTLKACMPFIKDLLAGRNVNIPQDVQNAIASLAENLALKGSPRLQKVMGNFLEDLKQKDLTHQLFR